MLRSEGMKRERRQDAAALPLGKPERTPQGGLRAPANLTRSGVFTYRNPDGSPRREYRAPSEVFAPEALASLRGAPVTREHPIDGYVTADDWRTKAVGHAGDDPRAAEDGIHVEGTVYVQDADVIAAIDREELGEISLGYDQVYVPGPGTSPEGEAYDGRQTMLRYNHVALVPKGRAGPSVALRLDSDGNQILSETSDSMIKINIGGKEYTAGSPEATAAISALEARSARADAAEQTAKAERRTRVAFQAKSAGVKFRHDADETSIMTETIKKIAPDLDIEGASPEYIMGAFAASISFALGAKSAAPSAPTEPTTDEPEDPEEEVPGASGADKVRQDAADARKARATQRQDADPGDPPDVVAQRNMIKAGRKL